MYLSYVPLAENVRRALTYILNPKQTIRRGPGLPWRAYSPIINKQNGRANEGFPRRAFGSFHDVINDKAQDPAPSVPPDSLRWGIPLPQPSMPSSLSSSKSNLCDTDPPDMMHEERRKRVRLLQEDIRSRHDSMRQRSTRQLRQLCLSQGKNPSGSKQDLIDRLLRDDQRSYWKECYSIVDEEVMTLVGLERSSAVSWCTKRALMEGYFSTKRGGLDQMIYDFDCPLCQSRGAVLLRDLLFQPDVGLLENQNAYQGAFRCQHCQYTSFVTGMCVAQPRLVESQEHLHCRLCPGYGVCLPDRTWIHCKHCGEHFEGARGQDDGVVCEHGKTGIQCHFDRLAETGYHCRELHKCG